jgi:hypothetical protein
MLVGSVALLLAVTSAIGLTGCGHAGSTTDETSTASQASSTAPPGSGARGRPTNRKNHQGGREAHRSEAQVKRLVPEGVDPTHKTTGLPTASRRRKRNEVESTHDVGDKPSVARSQAGVGRSGVANSQGDIGEPGSTTQHSPSTSSDSRSGTDAPTVSGPSSPAYLPPASGDEPTSSVQTTEAGKGRRPDQP